MEIEHIYGADVEVVRVMMMTCILVSSDIPRRVRALSGPKRTVLIYSGSKRGKKNKRFEGKEKKGKKRGIEREGLCTSENPTCLNTNIDRALPAVMCHAVARPRVDEDDTGPCNIFERR